MMMEITKEELKIDMEFYEKATAEEIKTIKSIFETVKKRDKEH